METPVAVRVEDRERSATDGMVMVVAVLVPAAVTILLVQLLAVADSLSGSTSE